MLELKVGDTAYYDSFNGLIPCRVQEISGPSGIASTSQKVIVTLRGAARPFGENGREIETNGLHVIPRKAIRFRKYGTRILPYTVQSR